MKTLDSLRARAAIGLLAVGVVLSGVLLVHRASAEGAPESAEAGKRAFAEVASVLQSPRCMNCHPIGDAPLQSDKSRPHAMNITRASEAAGMPCSTCHQDRNSEAVGVAGGPPGAPR